MRSKPQFRLGHVERLGGPSWRGSSSRPTATVMIERARIDPGTIQALGELHKQRTAWANESIGPFAAAARKAGQVAAMHQRLALIDPMPELRLAG